MRRPAEAASSLGEMAASAALVWIRGPGPGCKAVRCGPAPCSVRDFIFRSFQNQRVPVEDFFVKCSGVLVDLDSSVQPGALYSLEPRLRAGKGGFGSMLRALGAQIEKTTNREACRDLSGRRLRDVNHEKAMAEWVKQQAEREAEKEQKRLERLQRKLAEPKHCFSSPAYQQQCHEMAERLEDSVLKGMQAASSKMVSAEIRESRKRPCQSKTRTGASAEKRKCFWFGLDGLGAADGPNSESSDDDGDDGDKGPRTSGLSLRAPQTGHNGGPAAGRHPSGCQGPEEPNIDSGAPETPPKSPTPGSREEAPEDPCATLRGAQAGRKAAGESQEDKGLKEAGSDGPREEGAAGARPDTQAEGPAGGERAEAAPDESRPGTTDIGPGAVDLLAFSSAAELELLGLAQLKSELTALGLKCGGTLQERAARLFSVRGLAREQMDPALFAKPSKGKKK